MPIMAIEKHNYNCFSNTEMPRVRFLYYSFCVLSVYKVNGEELDLSAVLLLQSFHGKAAK